MATSEIGTFRTRRDVALESVMRFKADIGEMNFTGYFRQVTLNSGRPMVPASEVT